MSMPYSQYARLTQAFPVALLTPGLVIRLVRRRLRAEVRRGRQWRAQRHALDRSAMAHQRQEREFMVACRF